MENNEYKGIAILYEDNHLLVVRKPPNIPSQADSSGDPDMLTILKEYIKAKYNKPGEVFLGLVHRLDRPTGGVMVFARTSKAAERLTESIKNGDFEKKYFAIVCGVPYPQNGKLVHHLQKDEKNNMVTVVPASTTDAKRAELDYRVLESIDNQISLVTIDLITGRSHQARVQLSTMGWPIFGDARYGGDTLAKGYNLCLFAYELRFPHPISKNAMVFKVFPPMDEKPWNYFAIEKHMQIARPE